MRAFAAERGVRPTQNALPKMLTSNQNSFGWALLSYELDEATEHLRALSERFVADGACDEEELRVELGHIYAHLNRAWHRRDLDGEIPSDRWATFSQFPSDVIPVG